MRVIIIVVETPVPKVHQTADCIVPIPELYVGRAQNNWMLLIRASDCATILDYPTRVIVQSQTNGNEDAEQTDDGWYIEAQPTSKGCGGKDSECLIKRTAPDQFERPIRQNVAGNHEKNGYHNMTGKDHMEERQLVQAKILFVKAPADMSVPCVGEEEMKIENEKTSPSSQPIQCRDVVYSLWFVRLDARYVVL